MFSFTANSRKLLVEEKVRSFSYIAQAMGIFHLRIFFCRGEVVKLTDFGMPRISLCGIPESGKGCTPRPRGFGVVLVSALRVPLGLHACLSSVSWLTGRAWTCLQVYGEVRKTEFEGRDPFCVQHLHRGFLLVSMLLTSSLFPYSGFLGRQWIHFDPSSLRVRVATEQMVSEASSVGVFAALSACVS